MVIYANLCEITKKCFFFISRPILIVIALFGRAELRTLNFYTEFWNFAPLINYGEFMQIYSKKKKLLLPHFLTDFHSVYFIW